MDIESVAHVAHFDGRGLAFFFQDGALVFILGDDRRHHIIRLEELDHFDPGEAHFASILGRFYDPSQVPSPFQPLLYFYHPSKAP